jgi:hypothetical protein
MSALHDGPEDNDSSRSEDESEMERLYDWSTWRLYHRIVEHREKHPLTASYFHDAENAVAANGLAAPRTQRANASRPSRASRVHFDKSPREGEVFEMDL